MQILRTIVTAVLVRKPAVTHKVTVTTTTRTTVKGATCSIESPMYPEYGAYELRVSNGWSYYNNKCQFRKQDLPDIIATLTALYESDIQC